MYIPKAYQQTESEFVKSFVQEHPFGILVDQLPDKLWAVHLPFEWEEKDGRHYLTGHIARANPIGQQWHEQRAVMAIFQGAHTYISSSWYKEEEVPTWDYLAVHIYGQLQTLSEEETMAGLHGLVERYEAAEEHPIDLNTFSSGTLRQVKGVIGFRIDIEETHSVTKLSQTRKKDHPEIIKQLENRGDEHSKVIAGKIRDLDKA